MTDILVLGAMLLVALLPVLSRFGLGAIARPVIAACAFTLRTAFAIAAGAALLTAIVQLAAVVSRNIFAVNFIWLQESALYLFGAMFLLASGAVLVMDGHVRVDVFQSQFPDRWKRRVELAGLYLFVLPVALLVVAAAGPYVEAAWATREGSSNPSGIQGVYLLKTLIPLFGVLLAMAVAVRADRVLAGEARIEGAATA